MTLHGSTQWPGCYEGGTVKFYCPSDNTQSSTKVKFASQNVNCKVCAGIVVGPDQNGAGGSVTVDVFHGPLQTKDGVFDEPPYGGGYRIILVDECGNKIRQVVQYYTIQASNPSCCDTHKYYKRIMFETSGTNNKLMIVPFKNAGGIEYELTGGVAMDFTDVGGTSGGSGGNGGGAGTGQASGARGIGKAGGLGALVFLGMAVFELLS